ncbi:DUF2294 family protein [Paenibacillus nanensis]|uniref:DUF2294 family protein n=1 Tax=Paenibacillus nanensis TaxID=393251 RepID=A0A3A1UW08_9BACL|nr:Na-translocating system protein MpsC family protein [Paenibacillus nanensis]RIX48645.1 DUF2294 family protein [Paenibacillus nanensis]
MDQEKNIQSDLASHVARLLREAFGKGPQSVYVSIRRPFIVFYLRGLLSPTEKVLFEQDQVFFIQQTRDLLMKSLIPEVRAYISLLAGMQIREFYYDWGLHNHSGVFVGIESYEDDPGLFNQEMYFGKEELHLEIASISQHVQKLPEEIYSCMLNERTLLVIRNGILISIEKELIRLGYDEKLKLAKRNLEKGHLHNNNHFHRILNTKVIDVFADWDFELDKSVFVFMLNPTQ